MASSLLTPRALLAQGARRVTRSRIPTFTRLVSPALQQRACLSTAKHPSGFIPPKEEDLEELRERVQEFTRTSSSHAPICSTPRQERKLTLNPGREIPEEVAQRTDHENEFPKDMWRKLGEAGFLGITADEAYGGLSMGYQEHCVVMEEISRASGELLLLDFSEGRSRLRGWGERRDLRRWGCPAAVEELGGGVSWERNRSGKV